MATFQERIGTRPITKMAGLTWALVASIFTLSEVVCVKTILPLYQLSVLDCPGTPHETLHFVVKIKRKRARFTPIKII